MLAIFRLPTINMKYITFLYNAILSILMLILHIYTTLEPIVQRYINIKSPCHMPGKYEFFHPPLHYKTLLQFLGIISHKIVLEHFWNFITWYIYIYKTQTYIWIVLWKTFHISTFQQFHTYLFYSILITTTIIILCIQCM